MPFECPSNSTARVPKCLVCSSVQVLFEYPLSVFRERKCLSSVIWVPFKFPWSAAWVLKCLSSALRVKRLSSVTGNGLPNSFIGFLKNVPRYRLCKFYHILQAKSFKGVSKTLFKDILQSQKTKYDGNQSSLLIKIVVLQSQRTVLLLQLQNNWIFIVFADCFLPTNSCFM